MKNESPDADTHAVDAAVRAVIRDLAASENLRFATVAGELYETTLILICTRAKVEGIEAAALLEALVRLFPRLTRRRFRSCPPPCGRAATHGKN
jgi:hypothetical protein